MHPIVFVGGVPGSGKSRLCEQLKRSVPGLHHAGAGQLIRRALDRGGEDYVRPPVADPGTADRFQRMLVRAFSGIRLEHKGRIVLDGHFVVPTEGGPSPVEAEIFRRLGITALVLLEVDAADVAARLRQRPRPGWWDDREAMVTELLVLERQQAGVVAGELKLPLVIFRVGDTAEQLARELFGSA